MIFNLHFNHSLKYNWSHAEGIYTVEGNSYMVKLPYLGSTVILSGIFFTQTLSGNYGGAKIFKSNPGFEYFAVCFIRGLRKT